MKVRNESSEGNLRFQPRSQVPRHPCGSTQVFKVAQRCYAGSSMKRRDFIKSPNNEVGSSASGVADSLNFCFSITLCRFRNCSLFVEKIEITFDFIRRGSRLKPLLFFIEIELYHFTEYRDRLESANSQIIKFNRLIDEQASRKLHYYDHFQISFFILYRIND